MVSSEKNLSRSTSHHQIRISGFSSQYNAHLVLLVSNLIWGVTPIFLEVILLYLSPLQATTLRFGVGVLAFSFFLFFLRGRQGFSFVSSKIVILLGWIDALAYLAATFGQDLMTPGLSTLLGSFYVFLVPFIAWKLEGEPLSSRIAVVGLTSFIGIFLITWQGDFKNLIDSSGLGTLVLLFAAILWGFYTVLTSKYVNIRSPEGQNIDLLSFTYGSLFHTFLALVMLSFVTAEPMISFPTALFPHLLFLGLFPAFALGFWNWAIARLGSVSTSFFQLFQIIIPFLLEIVLFGQIYSSWIYVGILLILSSTIWVTEGNNNRESFPEKQQVQSQVIGSLGSIATSTGEAQHTRCCS